MIDINEKVNEANFFLEKLNQSITRDSMREVRYYLSAFLSASRSILQYSLSKAKSRNPSQQKWYENRVRNDMFLFFKNLRDSNIHRQPVSYSKNCTVCVGTTLIDRETLGETYIPSLNKDYYRYYFKDWPKNDDLGSLSSNYLKEIKQLVDEGIAKGYISTQQDG